jgi:DNA-binding MurR/RpiR family transcriptional regulator
VLLARLVSHEKESLAGALDDLVAVGSLPRAAALVVAARRRFVTGSGASLAVAQLMARDLAVGLAHVTVVDDVTVPALDVLAEVVPSDVLVAYALRGDGRRTAALARTFAGCGGRVVAVTDDARSSLARIADEAVVVRTRRSGQNGSPTAVVAASHLLTALAVTSAKGARRRTIARDRLGRELGTHP